MEAYELNSLLDKTADLIRRQKDLKAEEDVLRKQIIDHLSTSKINSISTDKVTVTRVDKNVYTYSKEIQESEAELKLRKKQEEAYGNATVEIKSHYMFSLGKGNNEKEYPPFIN